MHRIARQKNIPKLSNGTIFNDREQPVTHISMLRNKIDAEYAEYASNGTR